MAFRRFAFPLELPPDQICTPEQVAAMSWAQREDRVLALENLARHLIAHATVIGKTHMSGSKERKITAVAALISGGNDSTVMAYVMRPYLTHLVFGDTGTCLAPTRKFVEKTAADLGLPLIAPRAPRPEDQFEYLVRDRGFPGLGMHGKIYNRLKERAWRQARRSLVPDGNHQRMIFVAGRRRTESARRAAVPELEREDSAVTVSPMVLWTKFDLSTYRKMHDVPVNPVYDLLHISGECLCGCWAKFGEREWLFQWFADDPAVIMIRELEAELAGRSDIPPERRIWGCGGCSKMCPMGVCNE